MKAKDITEKYIIQIHCDMMMYYAEQLKALVEKPNKVEIAKALDHIKHSYTEIELWSKEV